MYTNQTRVHSFNKKEFKLAHEIYSSYMVKGMTPHQVVDALKNSEHHRLLTNYYFLLDVTTPHLRPLEIVTKIQQLKKASLDKIKSSLKILNKDNKNEREQARFKQYQKIVNREFADLKKQLVTLLKKDYPSIASKIYQFPEDSIELYVENLCKLINTNFEESSQKQTERDLLRVGKLYINGKQFVWQPNHLKEDDVLQAFEKTLLDLRVDKEIISMLLLFFHQKNLNYGGFGFQEKSMLKLYPLLSSIGKMDLKSYIEIDADGNLLIKNERFYSKFDSDELSDKNIQAKASLTFKISKNNSKKMESKFGNINIEILDSDLNIYDEKLREKYLRRRIQSIVKKIRDNRALLANDQLVIDLYLSRYKDSGGGLINTENLDENTLFLLAWNNVSDAEELFSQNHYRLKSFFTRSSKEIKEDLNLITDKHQYYPNLEKICEVYYKNLDLINNRKWKDISNIFDSSGREQMMVCMLSMADSNLVKNCLKEVLIAKRVPKKILREILDDVNSDLPFDVQTKQMIAQKISDQSELRKAGYPVEGIISEVLQKLDEAEKGINQGLQQSNIRTNLEGFVLTKYALMSEKIATNLLSQSVFERFLVRLKNLFSRKPNHEVPPKRFQSSDLRKIAHKFPGFWRTAFSLKKRLFSFFTERSYVDSLSQDDLHKLLDVKKGNEDSYVLTANQIVQGRLYEKVKEKISFKEAVQIKKLLPMYTFDLLSDPKGPYKTFWDEMPYQLSEEELYDFYFYKFEQDYNLEPGDKEAKMRSLFMGTVDFWSDQKPTPVVDGVAAWRSALRDKSIEINNDNEEQGTNTPVPILIMRRAIVDVVANGRAHIFLEKFVPTAGNYDDFISEKRLKQLHRDFLSNYSLLKAVLQEASFLTTLGTHPYLFHIALQTAKRNRDNKMIVEIYKVLSPEQILDYFQTTNECDDLLNRMIADEQFFTSLLRKLSSSDDVLDSLWLKAKPYQLYTLLLRNENDLLPDVLSDDSLILKLLDKISIPELAQLFSKYPSFIKEVIRIAKLESKTKSHRFQQIENALILCRATLPPETRTELLRLDHNLGLQLGRLESKLIHGIYKEDFAHLFTSRSIDLLGYLKNGLEENFELEHKRDFVARVVNNPELINKIIQPSNVQTYEDVNFLNNFLASLSVVYENTKSKDILQSLQHVINSCLLLAINQPNFGGMLFHTNKFKDLAVKFGQVELLALIFVQGDKYTSLEKENLSSFLEKLFETEVFEKYLPIFLTKTNFKEWFVSFILNGRLNKLSTEQKPLLSSEAVINLLYDDKFSGFDYANGLLRQIKNNSGSKFGEPDLRLLLTHDLNMRNKVLSSTSGITAQQLLYIFIHEVALGKTAILDAILSRPLFDYLLDNANSVELQVLFKALFTNEAALLKTYPDLVTALKEHYLEQKDFQQFVLANEFFPKFLALFPTEKPDYHRIILHSMSLQELSPVMQEMCIAKSEQIGRGFVSHASNEDIIKLVIACSRHNQNKVLDCILNSGGIFERLLSDTDKSKMKKEGESELQVGVEPRMRGEFLLWALSIIKRNQVNYDTKTLAEKLKLELDKYFKPDVDKFYLGLSVDQLIDLYVRDGFEIIQIDNNVVSRKSIPSIKTIKKTLFREYIQSNKSFHLLDHILLNASTEKLLELFAADPAIQDFYINSIYGESLLREEYAERLMRNEHNIIEYVINNFNVDLQIRLLHNHVTLRPKFLAQLKLKPELLLNKNLKTYMYVKLIVQHEETAYLEFLINAIKKVKKESNDVLDSFLTVLSDPEVKNIGLKHIINADIHVENNLIESMLTLLPAKEIIKLCRSDVSDETKIFPLESKIFAQMMIKPKIIQNFANSGDLLSLFRECNQPRLFYLNVLDHSGIAEDIVQLLQKELAVNQPLREKALKSASSEELALIVNSENNTKFTPLTKHIYGNQEFRIKLLQAVEKLDSKIVATPAVRDLVKERSSYREVNKSFMYSRPVSKNHKCLSMYTLYKEAGDNNRFYYDFFVQMSSSVEIDDQGVMRFLNTSEESDSVVPLRYAMMYYDALARLNFYNRNDQVIPLKTSVPNLQILIEDRPELRKGLSDSVCIDQDVLVFREFDTKLGKMVPHYRDAVLYAKCFDPNLGEQLEKFPNFKKFYLDSIKLNMNGKMIFQNHEIDPPTKYQETVHNITRKYYLYSTKPEHIKLIASLPDIEELLSKDEKLCQNICDSVTFEEKTRKVYFLATEEVLPQYCMKVLVAAMRKTRKGNDLLNRWNESPELKSSLLELVRQSSPPSHPAPKQDVPKGSSSIFNIFSHWTKPTSKAESSSVKPVEIVQAEELKVK